MDPESADMVLCRELTVVKHGIGMDAGADEIEVRALHCKCWHCEFCRPMRQRQLRGMGHGGKPDTFLTLTVNPAWGDGPDMRARELVKAWRHIVKCAKKETARRPSRKPTPFGVDAADWRESYGDGPHRRQAQLTDGKKLPFMAVFEKTKKGEPHLHLLLRVKWLAQPWISAIMDARINAPIVDIRRVSGAKQAASYISKYVGKEPTAFEGTKRYWRSQDWKPDPGKPRVGWCEIVKERYQDYTAALWYHGWKYAAEQPAGPLRSRWRRQKAGPAPPRKTWKEQYRDFAFI